MKKLFLPLVLLFSGNIFADYGNAIVDAVIINDIDRVKYLIGRGSNPGETVRDNFVALHFAAAQGSEELVKEVRDQYQAWKTKKEYDVGVKSPQL